MLMDAMPSKLQCGEGGTDSSESEEVELADVLDVLSLPTLSHQSSLINEGSQLRSVHLVAILGVLRHTVRACFNRGFFDQLAPFFNERTLVVNLCVEHQK